MHPQEKKHPRRVLKIPLSRKGLLLNHVKEWSSRCAIARADAVKTADCGEKKRSKVAARDIEPDESRPSEKVPRSPL